MLGKHSTIEASSSTLILCSLCSHSGTSELLRSISLPSPGLVKSPPSGLSMFFPNDLCDDFDFTGSAKVIIPCQDLHFNSIYKKPTLLMYKTAFKSRRFRLLVPGHLWECCSTCCRRTEAKGVKGGDGQTGSQDSLLSLPSSKMLQEKPSLCT